MFDLISENFINAVLVLDHRYHVKYMNNEARRLLQNMGELTLGMNFVKLYPEWAQNIERLEKFEVELKDCDQKRFFQIIPTAIILSEQLSIYVLQFFDITDFRLMEKKYLEVTNDLIQEHFEVLQLQEKLKTQVFRDHLTGAYNRRYMEEYIDNLIETGRIQNEPFTIAIIDLDHFKKINDFYGHKVGDAAILNVVKSVKMFIRKEDILCKFGGDELVLILPHINMSAALNRIDNIRKFIFQSPIKFKDHNIFITVSIGVSEFPTHGKNIDTVLRFADKALYRAKLPGRNRISSFDRKTDGDGSDPVIIHKKKFITGSS